jgi:energy-coupling factor transporter ATP-binding protein EcfA2
MATRTASHLIGATPVLTAQAIRRSFGPSVVLAGVDLSIARGEVVALLGGSGSGKSTLLRILAGLDGEATGETVVHGAAAVVFQEHRLLPWKTASPPCWSRTTWRRPYCSPTESCSSTRAASSRTSPSTWHPPARRTTRASARCAVTCSTDSAFPPPEEAETR